MYIYIYIYIYIMNNHRCKETDMSTYVGDKAIVGSRDRHGLRRGWDCIIPIRGAHADYLRESLGGFR